MTIWVLTPSRGRPDKAAECYAAFEQTKVLPETRMSFIVDADDPTFREYEHLPMLTYEHEGGGMGPPLNAAIPDAVQKADIVGFIGDDHRFRTPGWDAKVTAYLARPGVAYGDDLGQRENLASQVFISSVILSALGWMCLPGAKHLYLDNTWMEIGRRMDHLVYMPDVVIEHMHPVFGKAIVDEGYVRVNAPEMYEHDRLAFEQWMSGPVVSDMERVQAALR